MTPQRLSVFSACNLKKRMYDSVVPEQCAEQEKAANRRGERYYAAVSQWLESRERSWADRAELSVLARSYYKALKLARRCLEAIRRTPDVERKLKTVKDMEAMVERDLEALGSPDGQTP